MSICIWNGRFQNEALLSKACVYVFSRRRIVLKLPIETKRSVRFDDRQAQRKLSSSFGKSCSIQSWVLPRIHHKRQVCIPKHELCFIRVPVLVDSSRIEIFSDSKVFRAAVQNMNTVVGIRRLVCKMFVKLWSCHLKATSHKTLLSCFDGSVRVVWTKATATLLRNFQNNTLFAPKMDSPVKLVFLSNRTTRMCFEFQLRQCKYVRWKNFPVDFLFSLCENRSSSGSLFGNVS